MSIQCPFCGFEIKPKSPRPGRFTPKCPKCSAQFILVIPDPVDGPWTAAKPAPAVESTLASMSPGLDRPPGVEPSLTEATGVMPSPIQQQQQPQPASAKKPPAQSDATMGATGAFDGIGAPAKTFEGTEVFAPATKTVGGGDNTIAGDLPPAAEEPRDPNMPKKLGGYEILKELGRGGMGAVYLARQVSLDRGVALKVMNSELSDDPIFLARFIREAYAAAQLVHHNVVQIYDFGEDSAVHYFSMEFVDGRSLNDIVKKEGRVEAKSAVRYVVQAARGLKFAHDRGMIHRDIKPDNLMLNNQGVVKVADMGLVKTPSMKPADDALRQRGIADPHLQPGGKTGLASLPADMTNAFVAMGTPAYMSPEQCRDAANVDHRADIYSLGCTLYVLLTGRTPFSGQTAFEIMTKHATEEAPAPEAVVADLPKDLSMVIKKMMAKEAPARQQDMGEVIAELEKCLDDGSGSRGPFKPGEEHLKELERAVAEFDAVPAARLRKTLFLTFFGAAAIAAVASLLGGSATIAAGIVVMMIQTALFYFVLHGTTTGSVMFRKVRQWAFGARLGDYVTVAIGGLLVLGILAATEVLWIALGFGVLSAVVAGAMHYAIDRKLIAQRRPILEATEGMLKRFRLAGMDEDAIRDFVARYSGASWEEFYEALFGYEAKMAMRPQIGGGEKFASWRDSPIARIDAAQRARQEAREQKLIGGIESAKLEAEGISKRDARDLAEAAAVAMVERAAAIKVAEVEAAREVAERRVASLEKQLANANRTAPARIEKAAAPKVNYRQMVALAEKPAKSLSVPRKNPLTRATNVLFGSKLRFAVGAILVLATVVWAKQNLRMPVAPVDANQAGKAAKGFAAEVFTTGNVWKPLDASPVPVPGFATAFFDHFNPLIAGLILIFSLLYPGPKALVLSIAGAAVAFFGHRFGVVPDVGPLQAHQVTLIAGLLLFAVGVFLSRRR